MCYTLHKPTIGKTGGVKVGFAVVHMMKIKQGAVGGIQSHNNREHTPRTNPDVDMSRSGDNINLVPCDNYKGAIKEKVSALVQSDKAIRKDAVVVCDFIITSDYDTMEELGAEKQRAFFEDAVKWFGDRYGQDRVLFATVHMDEKTPHLHMGVVPITAEGRLSAKTIFTKTEMKAIQTEFARDVGAKYGLERGVEGSDRTHLSEMEFKIQKAQEGLDEIAYMADDIRSDADLYKHDAWEAQQKATEARRELSELQGDISTMKTEKAALTGEIEALKGQRRALSGEVRNRLDDAEKVRQAINTIAEKKNALQGEVQELQEERKVLRSAIDSMSDEAAGRFSRSSLAAALEKEKTKAEKEKRLSLLERFIELPAVRPLWEQFVKLFEKDRHKDRNGREDR